MNPNKDDPKSSKKKRRSRKKKQSSLNPSSAPRGPIASSSTQGPLTSSHNPVRGAPTRNVSTPQRPIASSSTQGPPPSPFSPALETCSGFQISFGFSWRQLKREGSFKNIHQLRRMIMAALMEERMTIVITSFAEDIDLFEKVLGSDQSASLRSMFTQVLIPLTRLLSSPDFATSAMRSHLKRIYAAVLHSDPCFLDQIVTQANFELSQPLASSIKFTQPRDQEVEWLPQHWGDVAGPIISLFYRIFSSLSDARVHPEASKWLKQLGSIVEKSRGREGVDTKTLENTLQNLTALVLPDPPMKAPTKHLRAPAASSSNASPVLPATEGPGTFRSSGPRHSNDKVEFRQIRVLPTENELTCSVPEYLPRIGDAFLPQGIDGYLGRIFRLYREDMIYLLRRAVVFFLEDIYPKRPKLGLRHHDPQHGVNLTLFNGCQLVGPSPTLSSAMRLSFKFPQPWTLAEKGSAQEFRTPKAREEFWSGPNGQRYWQEGSIVVIARDGETDHASPRLMLGVVCNRKYESLAHNERVGLIDLEMMSMNSIDDDALDYLFPRSLFPVLALTNLKPASFILFQIGGHFFRGYEPILTSLQQHTAPTFPFADLIVNGLEDAGNRFPPYITAGVTALNFSSLLIHPKPTSPPLLSQWERASSVLQLLRIDSYEQLLRTLHQYLPILKLDQSQCEAMVHSLTHEVSLIAGPPGTGKSYIGVRLVCVILQNLKHFAILPRFQNIGGLVAGQIEARSASSLKPILCLCYTNHALDQFLEDLLDSGVENVVRIGSRSKSERVMERNLITLARNVRLPREIYEKEKKLQKKCGELEERIKHIWESIQELTKAQSPGAVLRALKYYLEVVANDLFAALFGTVVDDEGFQTVASNGAENRYLTKQGKEFLQAHLKDWKLVETLPGTNQDLSPVEAVALRSLHDIFPDQPLDYLLRVLRRCAGDFRKATNILINEDWYSDDDEGDASTDSFESPSPPDSPTLDPHSVIDQDSTAIQQQRAAEIFDHFTSFVEEQLISIDEALRTYAVTARELSTFRDLRRLHVLQDAEIVGVTTTGASMHHELLRSLRAAVLVVEEAGEVFESHIIASLTEHTKHLVMIGDHQQLRPKCAVHSLSRDSNQRYDLDVSLFESLVLRRFSYKTLHVQRRMHPEISNLIRAHLYPELIDHPSVVEHPRVYGLLHRLWMLDIQGPPESQSEKGGSYQNILEATMAVRLVRHLVQQGYDPSQIVLLTPYVGQLLFLNRLLNKERIEIAVDERTEAEIEGVSLESEELAEEQELDAGVLSPKSPPKLTSATLRSRVRLSTVDNFQGEEADIVILSTVRNNKAGRLGFLKSDNRVNVMLSRARHGMIILCSVSTVLSCTSARGSLFVRCVRHLQERQRVDAFLPLQCTNHQEIIPVRTPDDFGRFSPDGGCGQHCQFRLACGHMCPKNCHRDDPKHLAIRCNAECMRPRVNCNHPCPRLCWQYPCPPCHILVPTRLPCGHEKNLPCSMSADATYLQKYHCNTKVICKFPLCEHLLELDCSLSSLCNDAFKNGDWKALATLFPTLCSDLCSVLLPCGHLCTFQCGRCVGDTLGLLPSSHSAGDIAHGEMHHPPCNTICNRDLFCGHRCLDKCHQSAADCGVCQQPCRNRCTHSQCSLSCCELCAPCAEPCQWICRHLQGPCDLPCSVPCMRLPCDLRCDELLSCGHRCPTVCGEACPKDTTRYCRDCMIAKVHPPNDDVVDVIMQTSLAEHDPDESPLVILGCGHALTIETADQAFRLEDSYIRGENSRWIDCAPLEQLELKPQTFRCPHCRAPLGGVFRYGRILNQLSMHHSGRRFAIFSAANIVRFSATLRQVEQQLVQLIGQTQGKRKTHQNRQSGTLLLKEIKALLDTVKNNSGARVFDLTKAAMQRRQQHELIGLLMPPMRSPTFPEAMALHGEVQILRGCQFVSDESVVQSADDIPAKCFRFWKGGLKAYQTATTEAKSQHCGRTLCKIHFQLVNSVCLMILTLSTRNFPSISVSTFLQKYIKSAKAALALAEQNPQYWVTPTQFKEASDRFLKLQSETSLSDLRAVFRAMSSEVGSNNNATFGGHWFQCPNGHIYTIGECGGAMQQSVCPECGATIGGGSHTLAAGNRRADEFLNRVESGPSSSRDP